MKDKWKKTKMKKRKINVGRIEKVTEER